MSTQTPEAPESESAPAHSTKRPTTADNMEAAPAAVGEGERREGPPEVAKATVGNSPATTRAAMAAPTMPDALAELEHRKSRLPAAVSASRLRGALDWLLFVVFLLPGFLSIFMLKRYGVDPTIVAGIAASIMVTYGMLAYFLPRVRVRPDRLGDNMYYMGFIFTLASMAAAIIDLQGGADISTLIGGFGIALFSTIVGIAGRVILLQMRTEVEDVEELVRRDLIDQAGKLRGQLSAAVHDLEIFRLGVRHSLEQKLNEAFAAHEAALEQQLKKLESVTEEVTRRVQASFMASESAAGNLRQAATESADALRALVGRFSQINPPSDLIEQKLDGTMTRVEQVIAEFERTAAAEAKRHQALEDAAAGLNSIMATMQGDIARFAAAAAALGRVGAPVSQLGSMFETFTAQVQAARNELMAHQATAARAHAQQEGVVSALAASQVAIVNLNDALARAAETSDSAGASLRAGIRGVSETLDANRVKLAELAAQSGILRERITADIDALLATLASVPKAAAAAAPAAIPIPPVPG